MDILHVTNIFRREDRLISLANEMKVQGVAIKLWEGIESYPTTAQNINAVHKRIIQWAKDNNEPYCIIAEDDIRFVCPGAWDYFLSQLPKPDQYDLFFGMIYSAEIKEGRVINGFSGLTLYACSSKFYQFFLDIPDTQHIDRALGCHSFEKDYLIIDKYVCTQSGGYSDNLKINMSYQTFEEKMIFYEG